jgi:transcriptional regulator with XRE-family HTH domain
VESLDGKVIGRRLRELRGVLRTQAEVADAVGVSQAAISAYEAGERIPSDAMKIALARFYRVDVGSLFFAPERHETCREEGT